MSIVQKKSAAMPARGEPTTGRRWLTIGLLIGLASLVLAGGACVMGWAYFHPRFDWRREVVYGDRDSQPLTLHVVENAGHTWLTMPFDVMRCAAWFDSRLRRP